MTAFKDEIVQVGSTKVRVLSGGQGEPLLFLHGASGGGKWLPVMEELAKKYHVIAPEHPGYGKSDEPEWLEEMYDLVLFYLDFMSQQKLDKVHMVGHSLGGWLAAEFAVGHWERLRSLTLVSAPGIFVEGVIPGDNFMWNREELIRNLYYNQELADEILSQELSSEETEIAIKNSETTAKLVWIPRWHNPKLKKRLGRIQVPTLVVWGKEDRLFSVDYAYAWEKLIPGARLAVFEECGHSPHIEKAEQFAQQLTDFYNNIS
jgi:pimeloyl-ACP methyl ester carboxylesterase